MKKLYLCRHGETDWTRSGQHTGRTDIPLTEKGKRQAALLRKRLGAVSLTQVFTSPKKRAFDTAAGMEAQVDPNLAEWDYGDYEGLTSSEIAAKDPNWNLFSKGAPGGETIEDVAHRAEEFLKKAAKIQGNVAVFSHGHFLRILAARYLGLEPELGCIFLLSVASLSILGSEHGRPAIALWNDTHHLQDSGESDA